MMTYSKEFVDIISEYGIKDNILSIDEFYEFVKRNDFKLIELTNKNVILDIEFFKDKSEWTCRCCACIRVIINGHVVCAPAIICRDGLVVTNKDKCKYFGKEKCNMTRCVKSFMRRIELENPEGIET